MLQARLASKPSPMSAIEAKYMAVSTVLMALLSSSDGIVIRRVELPANVQAAGVQGIRFLQQRDSRKMFRGNMPKKVVLTAKQGKDVDGGLCSVLVEGKLNGAPGCIPGWPSHTFSSSSSPSSAALVAEANGTIIQLKNVVEMHEEKRSSGKCTFALGVLQPSTATIHIYAFESQVGGNAAANFFGVVRRLFGLENKIETVLPRSNQSTRLKLKLSSVGSSVSSNSAGSQQYFIQQQQQQYQNGNMDSAPLLLGCDAANNTAFAAPGRTPPKSNRISMLEEQVEQLTASSSAAAETAKHTQHMLQQLIGTLAGGESSKEIAAAATAAAAAAAVNVSVTAAPMSSESTTDLAAAAAEIAGLKAENQALQQQVMAKENEIASLQEECAQYQNTLAQTMEMAVHTVAASTSADNAGDRRLQVVADDDDDVGEAAEAVVADEEGGAPASPVSIDIPNISVTSDGKSPQAIISAITTLDLDCTGINSPNNARPLSMQFVHESTPEPNAVGEAGVEETGAAGTRSSSSTPIEVSGVSTIAENGGRDGRDGSHVNVNVNVSVNTIGGGDGFGSRSSNDAEVGVTEFVELARRGDGLGFAIKGGIDTPVHDGETGIFISDIFDGGSAAIDGRLQIGDKILQLNRVSAANMRHDEAVQNLTSNPTEPCMLLVERAPTVDQDILRIKVFRSPEDGLGFSVIGGVDEPENGDPNIYINDVDDNGAASKARLAINDQLLKVGDTVLAGCTHGELVDMLRSALDFVELTVLRYNSEPSTTMYESLEEITFEKQDGEHGFAVSGGVDRPVSHGDNSVYITHVVEGGAADVDGRLRVEDRLVEVNGVKIEDMAYDQVVHLLQRGRGGDGDNDAITVVIARLPSTVEERCTVAFLIGSGGLGFAFRGGGGGGEGVGEEGIFVVSVAPSGSAAGQLCVDDRILDVNGRSFETMQHAEAATILSALDTAVGSTVALTVMRLAEPSLDKEIVVALSFQPCEAGIDLGFSIGGGVDEPLEEDDTAVYVIKVADGGPAHASGLRFGDRLITVGNVALTDTSQAAAAASLGVLRASAGAAAATSAAAPVTLQVGRLPLDDEEGEGVVEITFARQQGQYLGLSIVGGTDAPVGPGDVAVYVLEVVEEGAAACDGRLQAHDKLLVCNGQSLANVTHEDAVSILISDPKAVSLIVSRLENIDETDA